MRLESTCTQPLILFLYLDASAWMPEVLTSDISLMSGIVQFINTVLMFLKLKHLYNLVFHIQRLIAML